MRISAITFRMLVARDLLEVSQLQELSQLLQSSKLKLQSRIPERLLALDGQELTPQELIQIALSKKARETQVVIDGPLLANLKRFETSKKRKVKGVENEVIEEISLNLNKLVKVVMTIAKNEN